MATSDVLVQKWVARVLSSLADRDSLRQRPTTVLRALGRKAFSDALRRDLAEHLEQAGIVCDPAPEEWTWETAWVVLRNPAPGGDFQLVFRTENELSTFISHHWQRIPALSAFRACEPQRRLDGGRLICDLLFTRPRGQGLVVVELKRGKPGNEAVSELFGYVEALRREFPAEPLEAWLMSGRPNEDLLDDLRALSKEHGVKARWFTYGVSLGMRELPLRGDTA